MTLTVASLVGEATDAVTGFAPDMAVFIAAGVVISLAVLLFRRAVKAAR